MEVQTAYNKFEAVVKEIFSRATEIVSKAQDEFLYKAIVTFFFIKSWKTYQSIFLLCSRKFAGDAVVLVRSLLEMVVSLTCISQEPFQNKRALLFLEYDFVQRKGLY